MDEESLGELKQLGAIPFALKYMKIMQEEWQSIEQYYQKGMHQIQVQCEAKTTRLLPCMQGQARAQLAALQKQGQKMFESKFAQHRQQQLLQLKTRMEHLQKHHCLQKNHPIPAATEAATEATSAASPVETAATATPVLSDHVLSDNPVHSDNSVFSDKPIFSAHHGHSD